MRARYAILADDHSVHVVDDLLLWGAWMGNHDTQVARSQLSNDLLVSTVFLGLDHGWNAPIWFETIVFEQGKEIEMFRYATWDEAVEGHECVVKQYEAR